MIITPRASPKFNLLPDLFFMKQENYWICIFFSLQYCSWRLRTTYRFLLVRQILELPITLYWFILASGLPIDTFACTIDFDGWNSVAFICHCHSQSCHLPIFFGTMVPLTTTLCLQSVYDTLTSERRFLIDSYALNTRAVNCWYTAGINWTICVISERQWLFPYFFPKSRPVFVNDFFVFFF